MGKGQLWLGGILGAPVIAIVVFIIIAIIGLLGVAFFMKNILFIAIFAAILISGVQMVKNKQFTPKSLVAFFLIVFAIYAAGGSLGLFAMGVMNQRASITIESGTSLPLLAAGSSSDSFQESTFSFTCASPLAETIGCRLAPYTYRPVYIKVCNKDPELPIPPSVLLVTVDGETLRVNQVTTLNQIKDYWGSAIKAGDVFLTAGDKKYWWDDTVAWLTNQNAMLSKGSKYQVFYILNPVPVGSCVEFGKSDTGEATLFLVVAKGAKINQDHLLQVSLMEATSSDKVVSWSEGTIKSAANWFSGVPLVGGLLGGAAQGLVSLALFLPSSIANVFSMSADRTVFVTGAYKFLVAYPYVEIFVLLGVIGVLGLIITKFLKIW